MSSIALIPVVLGVVGLLAAFIVYRSVLSYSPGSGKVVDIGEKIHRGAMVFMRPRRRSKMTGKQGLMTIGLKICTAVQPACRSMKQLGSVLGSLIITPPILFQKVKIRKGDKVWARN